MARNNASDQPMPNTLSPFHTPPSGMPMPVPPTSPYGPNPGGTPFPVPPGAKSGPTPLSLLNALKRRWVLATFLGLLTAAGLAVGVWMLMPAGKHIAKAVIQLRTTGPDVVNRSADDANNFIQDQKFILRSHDLHERTLAEPSIASLPMIKNAEDPFKMLDEGIKVDAPSINALTVSLTGDSPDDMKAVLGMLVRKYVDDATAYERSNRDEQMKKLDALIERFRAEIQAKEKAIRLMTEANRAGGSAEATGAKLARMQLELAKLDAEVYATQKEIQELEITIALLQKKLDAKRPDLNPAELQTMVNSDPRVAGLLHDKNELGFLLKRDEERAAKSEDGKEAPSITNLKKKIAELDQQIAATQKLIEPEVLLVLTKMGEQQLRIKIADMQDKLNAAKSVLPFRQKFRDDTEKALASQAKGGFDIESLMKELEPQREYLSKLLGMQAQLMGAKVGDARVSIREQPFVMMNQNTKQKTILSVGAGVASFFLVVVLIGFLEWRTRRIDGVDQVVADLGMRVIGTVPSFPNKASLKAAEAAGNANWRFILNESINSTRTMLLHTARKESMQVVMVTSATQGEGKTSLTSQLATSMATAGLRTLIVDCDLRNPSIHKLFDLNDTIGVSEILCAEADPSDAVQPTAVPNLWIIPAGQCSTRVIAALAQGNPLETLFNRLRGQFDIIIVDSCPVLPVADALLIGQHVDGVLFSIMQNISQLPKVMVASEKLHQLNVPMLGAVVNNVTGGSAYYAYGYNYVKQLPA